MLEGLGEIRPILPLAGGVENLVRDACASLGGLQTGEKVDVILLCQEFHNYQICKVAIKVEIHGRNWIN